jgi:hypothetical protein
MPVMLADLLKASYSNGAGMCVCFDELQVHWWRLQLPSFTMMPVWATRSAACVLFCIRLACLLLLPPPPASLGHFGCFACCANRPVTA